MMQVVSLTDPDVTARRKESADAMREYADRMERGEITDVVIVLNDRENNCFERFGDFTDRWRLLGAIEHAKTAVFEAD